MNRERLQRIRNWQSSEFYAALVVRPISIGVMLVIADWRWLTPNLLTTLANLAKLGAAAAIFVDARQHAIAGAVLLQLGLLFDHLDGTVARYRGLSSHLGSFYDKVSDRITWFLIMLALGWAAYQETGEALMLVLAVSSSYALLVIAYIKWLARAEGRAVEWLEARQDPAAAVARHTARPTPPRPPERTGAEWLRWIGSRLWRIVWFEEVDLFLWAGLFLVLDRLPWLLWLLAVTQGAQLVMMLARRTLEVRAFDRRRRTLT
jgi:phosphatidylglycerophosphate synthase